MKASACIRKNCDNCDIKGRFICYADTADLVDFGILFINWFIPFMAGIIVGRFWWGLFGWLLLCVIFFGYVEAFLLCRHCPAYAEKGKTLRCHANWGLPKFPKIDKRPMNLWEKIVWIVYVFVLFLYPLPFFFSKGLWLMGLWSLWTFFMAAWIISRTQCTRCFMLSCPLNRTTEELKESFYDNFPDYRPDDK